jgi:hypothetical protein
MTRSTDEIKTVWISMFDGTNDFCFLILENVYGEIYRIDPVSDVNIPAKDFTYSYMISFGRKAVAFDPIEHLDKLFYTDRKWAMEFLI